MMLRPSGTRATAAGGSDPGEGGRGGVLLGGAAVGGDAAADGHVKHVALRRRGGGEGYIK